MTTSTLRADAGDIALQLTPIVALDFPDADTALRFLDRVPAVDFVKIGLQLYTAEGPDVVRQMIDLGRKVFLDLKLHDIPNTVAGAVRSAEALGVDLLTLHASGGPAMLKAAADAASSVALLGVTILTSMDETQLSAVQGREGIEIRSEVLRLAHLCEQSGIDGVVCSVHEAADIAANSPSLQILTPGIRLPGDAAGDQSRVATPAQAVTAGADYLVIGRSVTAANDPAAAYDAVVASISGAVG